MKERWIRWAASLTLAADLAPAQTTTGIITGRVVDPQGHAVPLAEVWLTQELTGVRRTTTTDASGDFVFSSVPPGRYSVTVNAQGFKRLEKKGYTLSAFERLSVGTLTLELGSLTESVTVTAEAPPIQTASHERSALLNDMQMSYLSTPGRDFMNLLKLLPGVTYPDGYGAQTFGTSSAPVIHGVRTDYVAINLDGVVANNRGLGTTENMVNLDAIAEVKVLLGNYQAEYGKNAGAIINVSTKSGTMEFHGTGYWYKRHEMWNANNFFNNRAGVAKPRYRYNTLGYNLGGPLYWPGKFNRNRDKLFFFWSQEIQSNTTPSVRNYTLPTERERRGDFSDSREPNNALIIVPDPLSGQPFPGNIIPAARINPDTQKLLGVFRCPTFSTATSAGATTITSSRTLWTARPARSSCAWTTIRGPNGGPTSAA